LKLYREVWERMSPRRETEGSKWWGDVVMAVVSRGLFVRFTNPRPNENRTQERAFLTTSKSHLGSEIHFTRESQSRFPPQSEPRLKGRLGQA
jgi:hypothetical protein